MIMIALHKNAPANVYDAIIPSVIHRPHVVGNCIHTLTDVEVRGDAQLPLPRHTDRRSIWPELFPWRADSCCLCGKLLRREQFLFLRRATIRGSPGPSTQDIDIPDSARINAQHMICVLFPVGVTFATYQSVVFPPQYPQRPHQGFTSYIPMVPCHRP